MTVRVKGRALLPAAGAIAAVATAVSGWAPIAQSSPTSGTHDAGLRAPSEAGDGTYESCGAYFGFGKESDGVLDVVDFDVTDQNGADGIDHQVPLDTQVVLELTNDQGEVLECEPVEVTEQQWDDAMDDLEISMQGGKDFPAWPGPGHFIYPSVSFDPFIQGFGDVVGVAFKVLDVPSGHTLVSPTDVVGLTQHYFTAYDQYLSYEVDERVQAVIDAGPGVDASAAFAAALATCDGGNDPDFTTDLAAAVNALRAFRGYDAEDPANMGCFEVGNLNQEVATLLGIAETAAYVEPIVLALPEETTTSTSTTTSTTTTSTTIPIATEPDAATPIPGSPTYTG